MTAYESYNFGYFSVWEDFTWGPNPQGDEWEGSGEPHHSVGTAYWNEQGYSKITVINNLTGEAIEVAGRAIGSWIQKDGYIFFQDNPLRYLWRNYTAGGDGFEDWNQPDHEASIYVYDVYENTFTTISTDAEFQTLRGMSGSQYVYDKNFDTVAWLTDENNAPEFVAGNRTIDENREWKDHSYAVKARPFLFTDNDDKIDFSNLTVSQKVAIYSGNSTNYGGEGNDTVVLGLSSDNQFGSLSFYGEGGEDLATLASSSSYFDGGVGADTAIFKGTYRGFSVGDKLYSDDSSIQITLPIGDVSQIDNVEKIVFDDREQYITTWASPVALSSVKTLNKDGSGKKLLVPDSVANSDKKADGTKFTNNDNEFMKLILGTPAADPQRDLASMSHHAYNIRASVDLNNYTHTGYRDLITGIKPVIDSLKQVFTEASKLKGLAGEALPLLLQNISSEGMTVPRYIDKTKVYSSHTWGTAIDLKVDLILDHVADKTVHKAIAALIPIFNAAGWVAGAGFSKEDDMHFEFSEAKLREWFPIEKGTIGKDNLKATSSKDHVFLGEGGDDKLTGGAGLDTLKGGGGIDTLKGGAKMDFFVFDTALNSKKNVDNLIDFNISDEIDLSAKIFSKIGKAGNPLDAKFLHIGGKANDANDHIVYNSKTGDLSYDSDLRPETSSKFW